MAQRTGKCPNCNSLDGFRKIPKIALKYMQKIMLKCQVEGCRTPGLISYGEFQFHECKSRQVACPSCSPLIGRDIFILAEKASRDQHWLVCPGVEVSCRYCFQTFPRKNLQRHEDFECK